MQVKGYLTDVAARLIASKGDFCFHLISRES